MVSEYAVVMLSSTLVWAWGDPADDTQRGREPESTL